MNQFAKLATLAAAGTLALTACNSGGNTTGGDTTGGKSEAASAYACPTGKLSAEGSSAQKNAIDETSAAYGEECKGKATVEYNPTGSGAGIKAFYNKLVDFAGSDSALKTTEKDGIVEADKAKERCEGNPAWNLPMVVGPVAIAYNVDGVEKLVLTPQVLAKIFDGTITKWNAPEIQQINNGATLPDANITVFFRSDESGTTENVTNYLNKAAGDAGWAKDKVSKSWKGKGEGKQKSSGVAEGVKATKNSISYMELSYAKDNQLKMAQIDNGAGPVELNGANVSKAIAESKIAGQDHDLKLELKYAGTGAGAYPINLVTYEIVCSKGLPAEKTALVKDYLTYMSSTEQQKALEEIGYAPLPADLQKKVQEAVKAIQ
ncbi:phosphate ABC transporter substrate-binding protein PstS [Mariniluteicoccus endophyticus]